MRLSLALKGAIQIIVQSYQKDINDDAVGADTTEFLKDHLDDLVELEREVINRAASTPLSDSEKSIIVATSFLESTGAETIEELVGGTIDMLKAIESEITAFEDSVALSNAPQIAEPQVAGEPAADSEELEDEPVEVEEEDWDDETDPSYVLSASTEGLRGNVAETTAVDTAPFSTPVDEAAFIGEPLTTNGGSTPEQVAETQTDSSEEVSNDENQNDPEVTNTEESTGDVEQLDDVETETDADAEASETETETDAEASETEAEDDWEKDKPF